MGRRTFASCNSTELARSVSKEIPICAITARSSCVEQHMPRVRCVRLTACRHQGLLAHHIPHSAVASLLPAIFSVTLPEGRRRGGWAREAARERRARARHSRRRRAQRNYMKRRVWAPGMAGAARGSRKTMSSENQGGALVKQLSKKRQQGLLERKVTQCCVRAGRPRPSRPSLVVVSP